MRATQHFHHGLLLTWLNKRKEKNFRETIWNIFGVFGFSEESKIIIKEKEKREKLFTRESSQQIKEETRNLFEFSFNVTTNYAWKKLQLIFWIFKSFFKHTRRKQEIKLAWIKQWKRMNTDNWNEMCEHECNVGEKYVLPQA